MCLGSLSLSLLTHNPQPSTFNPQPSTLDPQPSTLDPQPRTLNIMHQHNRVQTEPASFSSSLLSSPELSDTKVYETQIRARLGTAAHFCKVVDVCVDMTSLQCSEHAPGVLITRPCVFNLVHNCSRHQVCWTLFCRCVLLKCAQHSRVCTKNTKTCVFT